MIYCPQEKPDGQPLQNVGATVQRFGEYGLGVRKEKCEFHVIDEKTYLHRSQPDPVRVSVMGKEHHPAKLVQLYAGYSGIIKLKGPLVSHSY